MPSSSRIAAGPPPRRRAQPTVLAGGTLHLLVEDHRWRDQIDAARAFVLERLNRRLGEGAVRELQFGLAHSGALDEARRRAGIGVRRAPEALLDPDLVLGEARLEPALREAFLRAAEAAVRRRAAGGWNGAGAGPPSRPRPAPPARRPPGPYPPASRW